LSSSKTSGPHSKLSKKNDVRSNVVKYVSRGGHKLRGALDHFKIPVTGRICLDIGSSTGGFSDCLLQAGASSLWAVDVGYGLFDYTLKKDPRVHLLERTNFRFMDSALLTEVPSVITIDVSFISLTKILPKLLELVKGPIDVLAMVKPQFEGTPKEVPGGFVKDEMTRQLILERVKQNVISAGFTIKDTCDSTVKGRKGNQETFFYLVRHAPGATHD
jgi:23S rRNA (cytidine1920-2'-O)/16S rRNA (cytidine1409-2'-O)-methyltransferase